MLMKNFFKDKSIALLYHACNQHDHADESSYLDSNVETSIS